MVQECRELLRSGVERLRACTAEGSAAYSSTYFGVAFTSLHGRGQRDLQLDWLWCSIHGLATAEGSAAYSLTYFGENSRACAAEGNAAFSSTYFGGRLQVPDEYVRLRAFASDWRTFASNLRAFASNLKAFASNLRAFASNLRAFASSLKAFASNLRAFAANLKAFASCRVTEASIVTLTTSLL